MKSADYYRAVLLGAIVGMAFLSLFYVFLGPVKNIKPAEASEPKNTFTVVSQYKGCDIVRWDYRGLDFTYFLHCEK